MKNTKQTSKTETYNVTVLLSLHTDDENKQELIKTVASIPNIELHVDYDKSDRNNRFKLAAVSKILNDIDTDKPIPVWDTGLYAAIKNLKQILSEINEN